MMTPGQRAQDLGWSDMATWNLIIEDDAGRQTTVPFKRDVITIGRKEGNTVRLTERNVSRFHAKLSRENGHVHIEDLKSYNGIKLNGDRISGRVQVAEGDLIEIGDYHLAVQSAEAAKSAAEKTGPTTTKSAPAAEDDDFAGDTQRWEPPQGLTPSPGGLVGLTEEAVPAHTLEEPTRRQGKKKPVDDDEESFPLPGASSDFSAGLRAAPAPMADTERVLLPMGGAPLPGGQAWPPPVMGGVARDALTAPMAAATEQVPAIMPPPGLSVPEFGGAMGGFGNLAAPTSVSSTAPTPLGSTPLSSPPLSPPSLALPISVEAPAKPALRVEPAKPEPAKPEPAKPEPPRPELAKTEALKIEAPLLSSSKADSGKPEAAKVDAGKLDFSKAETARLDASALEAAPTARITIDKRVQGEETELLRPADRGSDLALPRLVVLNTIFAGSTFPLRTTESVIGRTEDNDVTIDHRSVSRNHAKLVREGERVRILDLKSANGVLVNNEFVEQAVLKPGDVIELGRVKIRYVPVGERFVVSPDEVERARIADAKGEDYDPDAKLAGRDGDVRDLLPKRNNTPLVLAAVVVLLAIAAFAVHSFLKSDDTADSGKKSGKSGEVASGTALATSDDGKKPADAKPVDAKPLDAKPLDDKPTDVKASDTKLVDAHTVDAHGGDVRTVDARLPDAPAPKATKPVADTPAAKPDRTAQLLGADLDEDRAAKRAAAPRPVDRTPPKPEPTPTASKIDAPKLQLEATQAIMQRRPADAVEPLQTVLKADPKNPDAHRLLGQAYAALGNKSAATDQYEAYLKLRPDAPNAESIRQQIAKLKQ
jgi:pSer/pThr/pTyr-binding forkhead associated (FHA) protein